MSNWFKAKCNQCSNDQVSCIYDKRWGNVCQLCLEYNLGEIYRKIWLKIDKEKKLGAET